MTRLRRQSPLFFTLLLAALLLRGFLPIGYMPGQMAGKGKPGLVFCTPSGLQQLPADGDGPQVSGDRQCPYGFAVSMGALPAVAAADLPRPAADIFAPVQPAADSSFSPRHTLLARGPPLVLA